jgi:hypothetical protein
MINMEAEKRNALAAQLDDIKARLTDLRRFL